MTATSTLRLTREEARRIAVRAQLLDADRPGDLLSVIRRLTFLQLDPTDAVAPSADLVAWSRLGDAYAQVQLREALDRDRTVFEHCASVAVVRPMSDLGLFRAEMAAWAFGPRSSAWLADNAEFRQRVLHQLAASEAPLSSREIPDTAAVPWPSTGWTDNRNVTLMLELLSVRGEVAVAGRQGRQRLWAPAERVFPADVEVLPLEEARRVRDEHLLRSLGVARAKTVGEAGRPAEIEGVKGVWRVDPDASAEGFTGRTALLSPFDRLVHDRTRAVELFDFAYTLEMYKPKAARRWGYFALPVLHHDRLVGKVDATADRRAGVLNVHAVHQDVPFTRAMTTAVDAELAALARWRGLEIRRS